MEELATSGSELTINAPKYCNAGSGGTWIAEAWRLFKSGWLEFLVAFVLLCVIRFMLEWLPFVGMVLVALAMPVLNAGYLQMAHRVKQEDDAAIGDLFTALRTERREQLVKLLQLGVVSLVFGLLMLGVMALLVFGQLGNVESLIHLQTMPQEQLRQIVLQWLHPNVGLLVLGLAWLVVLVFYSCAMWLSVPLLWFTRVGVMEALRLSLSASGRNAGALLVFGLLFFLLALFALIPIGLGLLVVLPMASISTYVAFRQIFVD